MLGSQILLFQQYKLADPCSVQVCVCLLWHVLLPMMGKPMRSLTAVCGLKRHTTQLLAEAAVSTIGSGCKMSLQRSCAGLISAVDKLVACQNMLYAPLCDVAEATANAAFVVM